jgi:hypothetical protein
MSSAQRFVDVDHARRVIAYSDLGDNNVVVREAQAYVLDYETRNEQRLERWMGWDD